MNEPRDSFDDAGNGRDPIDHDRMLRSIERLRMVPPAMLVIAMAVAIAAVIYWLTRH